MPDTVICMDMDGQSHEVAIADLRWRPSVYALVIKDNALLVFTQYNGYDLPGGGVELGEMLETALLREVKEETGIVVANPRLLTGQTSFFKLPVSGKGVFIQSILLYYVCDYVSGELSDEAFTEDEKRFSRFPEWLPLDSLDEKLPDGVAAGYDWRILVKDLMNQA